MAQLRWMKRSSNVKEVQIPLKFRSFGAEGGHLLVESWWKEMPVPLIVDTGSTHSLLHAGLFLRDERRAKAGRQHRSTGYGGGGAATSVAEAVLVVGGGGSVACSQEPMLVTGMQIGTAELPPQSWGLIDLGTIRNLYRENGYPPPCGLIGLDVLCRINAVIHCNNHSLIIKIRNNLT